LTAAGVRDRIAGAFHLRERGEQIRRDHFGRLGAEDRRVLAPGFRRRLVERSADREEELSRLARHLVQRVEQETDRHQHQRAEAELQGERRRAQPS
jgi:hypothetical protein